ncbi:hypothetical protein CB1_002523012 [Camelus ferus]|nr:hypothetical protein CB1_002523012 [Camelus ferus]
MKWTVLVILAILQAQLPVTVEVTALGLPCEYGFWLTLPKGDSHESGKAATRHWVSTVGQCLLLSSIGVGIEGESDAPQDGAGFKAKVIQNLFAPGFGGKLVLLSRLAAQPLQLSPGKKVQGPRGCTCRHRFSKTNSISGVLVSDGEFANSVPDQDAECDSLNASDSFNRPPLCPLGSLRGRDEEGAPESQEKPWLSLRPSSVLLKVSIWLAPDCRSFASGAKATAKTVPTQRDTPSPAPGAPQACGSHQLFRIPQDTELSFMILVTRVVVRHTSALGVVREASSDPGAHRVGSDSLGRTRPYQTQVAGAEAAQTFGLLDPKLCYLLDGILFIYGVVITALFLRAKFSGSADVAAYQQGQNQVYNELNLGRREEYAILDKRGGLDPEMGGKPQRRKNPQDIVYNELRKDKMAEAYSEIGMKSENQRRRGKGQDGLYQGLSAATKDTYDALHMQTLHPR